MALFFDFIVVHNLPFFQLLETVGQSLCRTRGNAVIADRFAER